VRIDDGLNTKLSDRHTSMTTANDLAVRRALEAAGVEFTDENGGYINTEDANNKACRQ
jgi:hypothetical protein